MENIIKTAIKGDWNDDYTLTIIGEEFTHFKQDDGNGYYFKVKYNTKSLFLDPEFWNGIQNACNLEDWQLEDIRNNFFAEVFRKDGDDPKGWNSAVIYLSALITKLRE